MRRQPLPAAAGVRALAALRAYGAHADPATRIANTIALLVGFNGPFYPLYVWFLLPEAGPAALATMAMSPAFLAIPWLSRRSAVAARAALPVVGLVNTVWTAALLGAGLLAQQAVLHMPVAPLAGLAVASQVQLEALNVASVGALLAFIVITVGREMRDT